VYRIPGTGQNLERTQYIAILLLFANLPQRMTTSTGRELARERFVYMQQFFNRLRQEIEGEL